MEEERRGRREMREECKGEEEGRKGRKEWRVGE